VLNRGRVTGLVYRVASLYKADGVCVCFSHVLLLDV
jgi:hypothetical protein